MASPIIASPTALSPAAGDAMVNAALEGNEKYILANKASIDAVSEEGYTSLYAVCMKGAAMSTLQLLLKLGAKVDLKGSDRETPLYIACHNNNVEFAKLLLAAGANVNEENGKDGETALHVAAKFQYIDLMLLLFKHNANINARTSRMETPLFQASKNGKHEAVYYLLVNNANPNMSNEDGKNALYIASEKGHKHCVIVLKAETKYLKEAKAEADVELKMRKPSVASTEEITERLRKKKEEDSELISILKNVTPATTASSAPPSSKTPTAKAASPVPSSSRKTPAPAAVTSTANKAAPSPVVEKMVIIPIEIPKLVIRDHDPITGESYGPCRSLDEVGYDNPPQIPKGMDFSKFETVRIGGTSMVVGTGAEEEGLGVEPKRVDMIPDDTADYGVIMPKAPKRVHRE